MISATHTSRLTALAGVTFLFLGCSVAPTMKDVEVLTADTHIVYGSVDVFGTKGKRQEWGMGWTGSNYFYLMILPAGSSEAITYKLDDDGMFYWALEPGDYTLLGYHWAKGQEARSGHLGAGFNVSDTNVDSYLGSIVLQNIGFGLLPRIDDRFDLVAPLYDAKFPQRQGTSARNTVDMTTELGNVAAFRHQCDAAWGIECNDRFRGITPLSPECKKTGFPMTPSLQPTFSWQASINDEVTYDLVLYEAAAYSIGGMLKNSYIRGHQIAYIEGLEQTSWTPPESLRPDTRYFWSVRLRDGGTVSPWSTQSHFTFALVAWSSGSGQWFQFKTS